MQETKSQQKQPQQENRQESRQTPEQQSQQTLGLTHSGELASALLGGESLFALPPDRLETLASLIGNQAMGELLASQSPPMEETGFSLPMEEPGTVPFSASPEAPALADPMGFRQEPVQTAPFDPVGLQVGG